MSSDGWEPVRKGRTKDPTLSIYADGGGHVNAPADQRLGEPDALYFEKRPAEGLLRFKGVEEDHTDGYAITREKREGRTGSGGDVRLQNALGDLGVDIDALEGGHTFDVDVREEWVIVNLADLAGVSGENATDPQPDENAATIPDDEPVPDDPRPDATADEDDLEARIVAALENRGELSGPDLKEIVAANNVYEPLDRLKKQGVIGARDDPTDRRRKLYSLADGSSQDPSPDVVIDAADAVDSVQELADLLDTSVGNARSLAMDVGVYTELQDAEAGYGKRGEV